jgi:hypothetical protein
MEAIACVVQIGSAQSSDEYRRWDLNPHGLAATAVLSIAWRNTASESRKHTGSTAAVMHQRPSHIGDTESPFRLGGYSRP